MRTMPRRPPARMGQLPLPRARVLAAVTGGVQKAPKTNGGRTGRRRSRSQSVHDDDSGHQNLQGTVTTSAATGKGACSGHGGVQKAPAGTTSTTTPATAAPTAAGVSTPAAPAASPAAKSSTATKSAPTATAGNTDPTGATAKCKDGTYSKSQHHSGTCSSHGGVAEWLTAAQ